MYLVPSLKAIIKQAIEDADDVELGIELAAERIDEMLQLSMKDIFSSKK